MDPRLRGDDTQEIIPVLLCASVVNSILLCGNRFCFHQPAPLVRTLCPNLSRHGSMATARAALRASVAGSSRVQREGTYRAAGTGLKFGDRRFESRVRRAGGGQDPRRPWISVRVGRLEPCLCRRDRGRRR